MLSEARAGRITSADGSVNPQVSNPEGSTIVVQGGGKYAEDVRAGNVFVACNQVAVATTAALATTYTGLVLGNPSTSGLNAEMLQVKWGLSVAGSDDGCVGIMTGSGTSGIVTSVTPRNRLTGGTGSAMLVDAGATLPAAPVLEQIIGEYGTGATNLFTGRGPHFADLEGSLIVTPGNYVAFYTTTATTAAFIMGFMWKEVAV